MIPLAGTGPMVLHGRSVLQASAVRGLFSFIHAVLRNALQNAMRAELVARNVAKLVQVGTPDYRVNRGVSVEQARALLSEAKSTRCCAF